MATKKKSSSTRAQKLREQQEQEDLFLQRRETIATACLQGILASGVFKVNTKYIDLAAEAVRLAEALIEVLDEDEEDEDEDEEDEEDEEENDEDEA